MSLAEYLDKEEKSLVRVEEGTLVVAESIRQHLIDFELTMKELDKKQKEMKANIKKVMKENGITKYESPDKRLLITLGEDTTTETVDKEKLWLKYPDVYRDEEIVKENKREGSLRMTIRDKKDE